MPFNISPKVYATENSPEEWQDRQDAKNRIKAECKELAKELASKLGVIKVFGIEPEDSCLMMSEQETLQEYYQQVLQHEGHFWLRVKEHIEAELQELEKKTFQA